MRVLGWILAIIGFVFFILRWVVEAFVSTLAWLWWIMGPLLLIAGIIALIYHYTRRRNTYRTEYRTR